MSGHNPLDKMDEPLKRVLRRNAQRALPEAMQQADAEMSASDAAAVISAMEAHDREALTRFHEQAARAMVGNVPVFQASKKVIDAHGRSDMAMQTAEDLWFALNGKKLAAAALLRRAELNQESVGDALAAGQRIDQIIAEGAKAGSCRAEACSPQISAPSNAPRNPHDVVSETIEGHRSGRDVGGEGHGSHRVPTTARGPRDHATRKPEQRTRGGNVIDVGTHG